MSLPSASALKDKIKALAPSTDKAAATQAFVDVIGDFMDQIQAGPTGSPGILKFGRPAMFGILMTLAPVTDGSWMIGFANAWQAGMLTSIVTPGTVSNPAWLGSGNKDILTLPAAAATIPTIAAGFAVLLGKLAAVKPDSGAPQPLADAVHAAALVLIFICIGLGPPIVFPPIPIPIPAQ